MLPILRTPAGVVIFLALLGVSLYSLWTLSGLSTPHTDLVIAGGGLTAIMLLLAGASGAIALRSEFLPRARRGWLFIALGGMSLALSYALRFGLLSFTNARSASFSAEILKLVYFLLVFTGLLYFSMVMVGKQQRAVLYLDLLILALGLGSIYWYLLLAPDATRIEPNPQWVMGIVFPAGDLLLLATVIALALRDLALFARRMLITIAIGMACAALGDYFDVREMITGISINPAITRLLWMCSGLFLCLAAAQQMISGARTQTDKPSKFSSTVYFLRLTLPYLVVALSVIVFVDVVSFDLTSDLRLGIILYGTAALMILAIIRQYPVWRENVRLARTVRGSTWTDGLTGLYNRQFINEMLPRELERARRSDHDLAVLLLDLNGFREYNDTYGHLEGDAVLKAMAEICVSQLRRSDIIARFGGGEFVIILPGASRSTAEMIARRVQNILTERRFHGASLGLSFGIGVYRSGLTPQGLLTEADQDLHGQKAK